MTSVHQSVLLNEIISGLALGEKKNPLVLDATFGGGGHSRAILERYPEARVVALDQDAGALERARKDFKKFGDRIVFLNANFRNLGEVASLDAFTEVLGSATQNPLEARPQPDRPRKHTGSTLYRYNLFDTIIFDLGLSSDQLENSKRGFSFIRDEPLLMTFKEAPGPGDLTAETVLNEWSEEGIANALYGYGGERFARRIAGGIAVARKTKRVRTTGELSEIIARSVPAWYRRGRLHFATRTFQALRIVVNDELGALMEGLKKGFECLKDEGRMAVISFHSLEDRIVKDFCREKEKEGKGERVNKKPITPTREEIEENKRARSAKLRILIKTS